MPDDLQMPLPSAPPGVGRPSYRIDRQTRTFDPATRRLLAFAAGALALLLAVGGSWMAVAHRSATVPVIEADSRPLRVKPDNPGGMQVAGADEPDDAPPTLAPAPEAPAPLALRAQVQANQPPPASSPPASSPPASSPSAAQLASVPPPETPAPSPRAAATATPPQAATAARPPAPAVAAPPASAARGAARVQLAAVDSEDAARAEWARLQRKYPDLLGGRQPSLQRAPDKDGKPVWRVRTGGFADLADATAFCAKVRAKGAGCSLGTF